MLKVFLGLVIDKDTISQAFAMPFSDHEKMMVFHYFLCSRTAEWPIPELQPSQKIRRES